jgi:Na+/H+ antiporter NhaD/arsenite permease-like protein
VSEIAPEPHRPARITSRPDRLRLALWAGAVALVLLALAMQGRRLGPAAQGTADPFLTLAGLILAAVLADRLGVFRLMAHHLVPDRAPRAIAVATVLAFAALVSALVNLDVAVVVAMPVALRAAQRSGVSAERLAAAVALTANASSFLLPTSNITNLLVLEHSPLSAGKYLRDSWLAWLLVTSLTIGVLATVLSRAKGSSVRAVASGLSVWAVVDLAPMFLAASAIRALLGAGLTLHGTFFDQVAAGSVLASTVNNLPAAAAVRAVGSVGRWAAIMAMAVGPNLFITGSVATLICRRLASDGGARLTAPAFSAIGLGLAPMQLAAAFLGLRIAGALR